MCRVRLGNVPENRLEKLLVVMLRWRCYSRSFREKDLSVAVISGSKPFVMGKNFNIVNILS